MLGRRSPLESRLEQGVSLVELLIGLAVGSLIVAGGPSVFFQISFFCFLNVRMVRLNEQMRSTLDLIRRDLQRAGYVDAWPAGATEVSDLNSAAMGVFGSIVINGDGNCITYSYDYDNTGPLFAGVQNANELFGFRLDTANGVIQRTTTDTDCTADWTAITDSEVVIETLSFELVQPSSEVIDDIDGAGAAIGNEDGFCDPGEALIPDACIPNPAEVGDGDGDGACESGETCLARRKINVVLEASLAADPAFTIRLREEIKVKNDRFFIEP